MGWTCYYRAKGETDLAHLQRELFNYEGSRYRLLDSATVRMVFYGVLEVQRAEGEAGEPYRTAVVVLQQRTRGEYNYGRKEMDEGCGPCEAACPERILRQLSPLSEVYPGADFTKDGCAKWAADWRARCEANISKAKARPRVKQGDVVKVSQPWTFRDGTKRDTFTLVNGRRNVWQDTASGIRVRLPARDKWPSFEVIPLAGRPA